MFIITYELIGIGLLIGISLTLAYLTNKSITSFLAFALFIDTFLVYADILEVWTLILIVILVSISLFISFKNESGGLS